MKNIKAILIDEEKDSRELVKRLFQQEFPFVQIVAEADSVKTGIDTVQHYFFDLLFLGIQLPDGSGFEVLEESSGRTFDIIFLSGDDRYAISAIKFNALDYLLKPVERGQFKAVMEKYLLKKIRSNSLDNAFRKLLFNSKQTQIALPTLTGFMVVNTSDILRLESKGNYTLVYCLDGRKIMVSKLLKVYEKILPSLTFCRIHHSHIVNVNCVREYIKGRGGQVILQNGTTLSVSENRKKDLLKYWA